MESHQIGLFWIVRLHAFKSCRSLPLGANQNQIFIVLKAESYNYNCRYFEAVRIMLA